MAFLFMTRSAINVGAIPWFSNQSIRSVNIVATKTGIKADRYTSKPSAFDPHQQYKLPPPTFHVEDMSYEQSSHHYVVNIQEAAKLIMFITYKIVKAVMRTIFLPLRSLGAESAILYGLQ
ncbi:hypothetical protein BDQ17DRAFT_1333965 [Cyathus striatus]|nr:hypothetical protein BDQ17DRAFT_1333965 [Cyathus striatus]